MEIGGVEFPDSLLWRRVVASRIAARSDQERRQAASGVPGNPDAARPVGDVDVSPSSGSAASILGAVPPSAMPSGSADDAFADPLYAWIRQLRGWAEDSPERLREVQLRLWALGHYPDGAEPAWGEWDQDTLRAVLSWTRDAQFETEEDVDPVTGRIVVSQRPFDDVLRDMADGIDLGGPEGVGEAQLDVDPAAVVLASPQQAIQLLEAAYARAGRVPTAEDKRAFVTVLHSFQRQRALAEARFRMQVESGGEGDLVEMAAGGPGDVADQFARDDLGAALFEAQPAISAARTIERGLGPA